jgi:hypothetical protein
MANLISSIVSGFGFTLGRTAATSLLTSSKQTSNNNSKDTECWSHKGYEEGDVEFICEYEYLNKFIKWYMYPVIIFLPYLSIFYTLKYFFNVFIIKNKITYYEMKWNTYKVSDARTKSGFREIKKLEPEVCKVEVYPPYTRNKIEAIIALTYSLFIIGIIVSGFIIYK